MPSRTSDNTPMSAPRLAPTDPLRRLAGLLPGGRWQKATMGAVDMELAERILELVACVPPGRVTTYGDIAALAGTPSPRLVGRVLAELSEDDTPWHRVLRSNGTPAAHLLAEQCARLRAEGVTVKSGRVDLARYRWRG